jgi:hypothetical protein
MATRAPAKSARTRRWSAEVLKHSNALDLEPGVFNKRSARAIARSLQRSAMASHRRKSEPYRSAMSMLNFHINRAGRNLSASRRKVLEQAKQELRRIFGRSPAGARSPTSRLTRRSTPAAPRVERAAGT